MKNLTETLRVHMNALNEQPRYTAPYNAQKLIPTLPMGGRWSREVGEVVFDVVPTTMVDEDGILHISGEEGDGLIDYYGEFSGGDMYICDELEQWAKKLGCYWEWDNPGSISLVKE